MNGCDRVDRTGWSPEGVCDNGYDEEFLQGRPRIPLWRFILPASVSTKTASTLMESLQQCTLEQRFQKSTKRLETFDDYFSDIPPGKDREYVEAFIPNIESMANLFFGEETSLHLCKCYAKRNY